MVEAAEALGRVQRAELQATAKDLTPALAAWRVRPEAAPVRKAAVPARTAETPASLRAGAPERAEDKRATAAAAEPMSAPLRSAQ